MQARRRELPRLRPRLALIPRDRVEEQRVAGYPLPGRIVRVVRSLFPDRENVAGAVDRHGREVSARDESGECGDDYVLTVAIAGRVDGKVDEVAAAHEDGVEVQI